MTVGRLAHGFCGSWVAWLAVAASHAVIPDRAAVREFLEEEVGACSDDDARRTPL